MKLVRLLIVLSLVLSMLAFSSPVFAAYGESKAQFAPDTIIVKFKAGANLESQQEVHHRHGGIMLGRVPELSIQVVKVPPGQVLRRVAEYRTEQLVAYAEPDGIVWVDDTPTDPYLNMEWGLLKIQAQPAWDITKGSSAIKIAVLDTGIDSTHQDLAGKVVAAINFTSSATELDNFGHGTHVAGTIAAATNNGLGIAGIGYNSSLMNVKVIGDGGTGTYSDLIQGIVWAANNGARVINMSLGGSSASSALEDAVNYAWSKGLVVVAAAGNSASSTPFYPAYYANVIAVAATDQYDQRAVFSNYGDWVDVGAPGMSIYSTVPSNGYKYMSGTSMASPHVAGLAALVLTTVSDTNHNGFLNDEARTCIQNTAEKTVSGIGSGRINAYGAVTCSTAATGAIAGTVKDASSGAPISGAKVTDGVRTASTDASGAYTIAGVPPGTSYTVTASASGYSSSSWIVAVYANLTTLLNFSLTSVTSGAVTGKVTDAATAAPIAGATVTDGARTTTSDSTGAYTLSNVPQGKYTVSASATGYVTSSLSVVVTTGQITTANFALAATAGAIAGTVKDASTGVPIAGATVSNGVKTVLTDVNGAYTITNVAPGSYVVTASASGYNSASQTVSISGNETASVNFMLKTMMASKLMWVNSVELKASGSNLRIMVNITSDSGALAGASVVMQVRSSSGRNWSFSGETDTYGNVTFMIKKVPSGTYTATVTDLTAAGYTWASGKGVNSGSYVHSSRRGK